MRKPPIAVGPLLSLALASAGAALEREMNVTQGPDAVFDRPPGEMLPALVGATPTNENGRVGNELVFWGYEQTGGRRVYLFACAQLPDVDCGERLPAMCPGKATVLETQQASGKLLRRTCRDYAVAAAGEVRPGCHDRETSADVLIGLVSCS